LLGCETVQGKVVGRLPYPAALDLVRCEQFAAPFRGMRSESPTLRLSNRACILDELISPSRQVQFSLSQPAFGELVRTAQGLADADRLYRLRYCPAHTGSANVCD